jgi:hypothetical protein
MFWQPIGDPIPSGAEWVGSVYPDAEGTLHFHLPRIRSVGIADLSQVVEHRVVAAVGSVSHHVRFRNGGGLWFVFNDRNELVDLKAHAFGVLVTPEGDCIFREFEPLTGQPLPSA